MVCISSLNTLPQVEQYTKTIEDYINRPNVEITATLTHQTEDYIRIIKTMDSVLDHLKRALEDTHGIEQGRRRYAVIAPMFEALTAEIGADLGANIVNSLTQIGGEYL